MLLWRVADIFLFTLHLSVVLINMFGMFFRRTRKIQIATVCLTMLNWFGLGYYYGFGYCILTDLEWQVKAKYIEGFQPPGSWVKYYLDLLFNRNFSDTAVEILCYAVLGVILLGMAISYLPELLKRKLVSGRGAQVNLDLGQAPFNKNQC
ncbi:MAG: DUF2784 family protein [Bacillota bacterium]